ncbi:MAG: glycosyltransferase [Methylotenera sp.]|nr:MAG: glycosyltransferase [Methylotenera sp.]
MPRIKILQLLPNYNVKSDNATDLAEQILIGLPPDQFDITSGYLSGRPTDGQPVSVAAKSHYFDIPADNLNGLRIAALWKVFWYCRQHQFDVIICNRFKTVSVLLLLNKILRIPLCIGISHVINEYRRTYRRWQVNILADKSWHFIGVSDAVKESMLQHGKGFTANNTHAIVNAIDVEGVETRLLSKEVARQKLNLPSDAIIIGAIGRLVRIKGHVYLIEALANLASKHPDAHLGIIGAGYEEENLKAKAQALGISNRVHFLGFTANAIHYVKGFDIWTMPSLQEGLGLALLEGMVGRLPVVASDIPAMKPLIEGAGGLKAKPKSVEDLTNELDIYLSMSSAERSHHGEIAYQYVKTQHNIETYRKNYRDFILLHLRRN